MGRCFSSCLPASDTARALCNLLSTRNSDFTFLVEETGAITHPKKRTFLSKVFQKHKDRRKKPMLEMVDSLLNPHLLSYSRLSASQRLPSTSSSIGKDIQLQCLDARALLGRTDASTPENSLDLEWEHETLPTSMLQEPSRSSWTALPEDLCEPQHTGGASDSDWSRVSSSANSLEWDSVQNSIQSDLDTDTQFLLNEIDRLTSKALKETGLRPTESRCSEDGFQ